MSAARSQMGVLTFRTLSKMAFNRPLRKLALRNLEAVARFCHTPEVPEGVDPFELHYVDPSEITGISGRPWPRNYVAPSEFGAVEGGDWDRHGGDVPTRPDHDGTPAEIYHAETYEQTVIGRSLLDRFNGSEWSETDIYQWAIKMTESENPGWRGMDTKAEIEQRCSKIDTLYERISEQGYHTQEELVLSGVERIRDYRTMLANEVLVDVGRDGELLLSNGYHRLAVAKSLKLDLIPVVVTVRHKQLFE